jgi:hypothetical protein
MVKFKEFKWNALNYQNLLAVKVHAVQKNGVGFNVSLKMIQETIAKLL